MPAKEKKEPRFGFGENWQNFLAIADEKRIERAKDSLLSFFGMPDLKGKSFVDIGSGSGLFSYAAYLLGAKHIVSFDFDSHSVSATKSLWGQAGEPAHWTVEQGSALDVRYLTSLGQFDIVYSWGVLHHTGAMWEAIRNTAALTAPGGLYCIALYNKVEGRSGSRFWLAVKRRYNQGSGATKKLIEWLYIGVYYILAPLSHGKNPLRFMREYGGARGMNWRRDVTDWVGGYPYEYASTGEVFAFMKKEFPSFRLENLKTVGSIGNNWFLFRNET
jgi:2-polyprenyl-6-hydroxyphenyl methylase/3-demethylubiquinone-9 3-methyltransferase